MFKSEYDVNRGSFGWIWGFCSWECFEG